MFSGSAGSEKTNQTFQILFVNHLRDGLLAKKILARCPGKIGSLDNNASEIPLVLLVPALQQARRPFVNLAIDSWPDPGDS